MHDPGVVVSKAQAQQLIGESPWRDRLSRSQSCLQVKRRAQEHNVMTLFEGKECSCLCTVEKSTARFINTPRYTPSCPDFDAACVLTAACEPPRAVAKDQDYTAAQRRAYESV